MDQLTPQTAIEIVVGFFTLAGLIGAGLGYMRRGWLTSRDTGRAQAVEMWRTVAEAKEAFCDVELAERDHWIGRLERHHVDRHGRCGTGPSRDG